MWNVTLKGITQRKRRFFSTVLAIILSVSFLTGVSALSDSIRQTFDSLFSSVYGHTDVVVTAHGTLDAGFRRAPKRLPRTLVDDLAKVGGIDAADGLVQSYAQVIGKDGLAVGGSSAPTFGSVWATDQRLNPFTIDSGRPPAAPGEIVIDRNTARVGKLVLGDSVQVLTRSEPVTDKIVGVSRFGNADSPAGFAYTHFTAAEADQLFQTNDGVDQILMVGRAGTNQTDLKAAVTAALPTDQAYDVYTGAEATLKRQSEFKERLKGFTVFLTVFALVALFVATFVIFNTFQIILAQRQREMALLRAVGASRSQLVRSVLLESAVLGLIASLLGIVVGLGVASGLKALLTAIGFPLTKGPLILTANTIRKGMLAGIVSTMVAALVPALRAARIPPIAALAETVLEHRKASKVRIAAGILVLAGAAALVVSGLRASGNPAVYRVGIAAGVTVFGLLLVNPAMLVPFTRSAGAPMRMNGMAGQLAQENVVRSPRRNALTAFPLLFGAALVGLLLVFTASFKAQVSKTIEGQFKGDFFVTARGNGLGFSPKVAATLAKVDGVEALTPVRFFFGDLKLVDDKGASADSQVIAVDPATVLDTVDIPVLSGSIRAMTKGTVAVGNDVTARYHWKVGDNVTMQLRGDSNTPLKIAAIIDANKVKGLFQGASALIGIDTFEPLDPLKLDQIVYVRTTDHGRNHTAELKNRLSAAVKAYPNVEVGDLASYKKLVDKQVGPFVTFMIALLGISVVIATVGVANTMKLSIAERTRELGLLRAVGMHRGQARSMVRWEAITISTFGVIVGALLGAGFGVAIMRSLRSQGFTESAVPVGQFVVMAIFAALLGLLAASGAARRVSKLNVLRAIAVE